MLGSVCALLIGDDHGHLVDPGKSCRTLLVPGVAIDFECALKRQISRVMDKNRPLRGIVKK
jgi:hypothetical protein